jgi:hypothetical protein
MQPFTREPKATTPYIHINYETGHFEMRGVSHPENVFTFYNPVYEGIRELAKAPVREVVIDFAMEYFNTSSARCIFMMLKEIKNVGRSGKYLKINWIYEEDDEDMLETGEDFQELIELEFNFVAVEDV